MKLPDPSLINRRTPTPGGQAGYLRPTHIGTPGADTSIGDVLQGISDEAYKFAMAEKARMDDVAVDDAKNQYLQQILDIEGEYSEIKGKAAVDQDIVTDYTTKLDGVSEKLSSGFKNDSQRRAWDSYYGKAKVQFTAGVMRHKLNESDQYSTDTYKATNITRIQNAHSNWADAGVVNNCASDIVKNIAKEKERLGWGDERTEVELKTALGPLWSGVAAKYINAKQYKMAKKILDQHQDVIGVDKYTSYHKSIEARETIDLSQEHADRINSKPNSLESKLKEARDTLSGDLEDATVDRLKIFYNEDQARKKEIELEKTKLKEKQEEGRDVIRNDFLLKYNQKKLSVDEILESDLEAFGSGSKQTFLKMIGTDPSFESDKATYNSKLIEAYEGKIKDPNSILGLVGKTLNGKDAEHIMGIAQKPIDEKEKVEKASIKRAIELGEKSIRSGFLSGNDPNEEERAYKYEKDLTQTLEDGKIKGLEVNDMLDPNSKDYILDSLISRHTLTFEEEIMQKAERFTTTPSKVEKRKKGETINEYLKRVKK